MYRNRHRLLAAGLIVLALSGTTRAATYYVAATGSDSNNGTSSGTPWKTIAKVAGFQGSLKPGDKVLFNGGDVWNEDLILTACNGSSGNPIIFSTYGTGRAIIDGSSTIFACVEARQDTRTTNVSYLTVDNFECRNTTGYGITFITEAGNSAMPGITISNNYVHNTGPGACSGCGTPNDPGGYRNQLNFEADMLGGQSDGVQVLNNTVNNCGGHNCLQVHGDQGNFLVRGNSVGPGCVHGCLDVKMGVGTVDQNTVTCPACTAGAPCYYTENTDAAHETLSYTRNIANNCPVAAFQAEDGGTCTQSPCMITLTYYNNTVYTASGYNFIDSSCNDSTNITVKNTIVDGGTYNIHSACRTTWDYNDNGGSQGGGGGGAPTGGHNVQNVNPIYVTAGSDFHLQATSTLLTAGQPNLVDSAVFIGALGIAANPTAVPTPRAAAALSATIPRR
jgi:hypothetical protein